MLVLMGYPAATKNLKVSRLNSIFGKKPRVEPAQPEYIRMGSGWLRVVRGGCGAKAPPLVTRPATPLMTLITDLGLSMCVSMFEHVDW